MKNKKLERRRFSGGALREEDHRTASEKDLARLIHSAAFRRLQSKTQVLGIGEGDFHRTRLTHSMEVAQVGKGIVSNLLHRNSNNAQLKKILPDTDLIFCIGLAHDIGHPPFGHGGEVALNYCMRNYGGFEGNGQTLRILSKTESHTKHFGLNLTRRALLGILKYPVIYSSLCRTINDLKDQNGDIRDFDWIVNASEWKPPKCYHDDEEDVVNWVLKPFSGKDRDQFTCFSKPEERKHGKTRRKSLDTTIMELADDISYGVHDLEDAIVLGLITKEMWHDAFSEIVEEWAEAHFPEEMGGKLFSGSSSGRKQAIGELVHFFIVQTKFEKDSDIKDEILGSRVILSDGAGSILNCLKKLVMEKVIFLPEVQTLEFRGQHLIIKLFEAIASDPKRFLKKNYRRHWERFEDEQRKMRVICDFIAGMTDEYATRMYERMFQPRTGTIFQRL